MRLGGQRGGKRTAAANLFAYVAEDRAGAGTARAADDKTQRTVEVLTGGQHDREFPGSLRERRLVEPPPAADIKIEQIEPAEPSVGRIGAQHELPLTLQPVDNAGAVRCLHLATDNAPTAIDRGPAEPWHRSGLAAGAAQDFLDRRVAFQYRH